MKQNDRSYRMMRYEAEEKRKELANELSKVHMHVFSKRL